MSRRRGWRGLKAPPSLPPPSVPGSLLPKRVKTVRKTAVWAPQPAGLGQSCSAVAFPGARTCFPEPGKGKTAGGFPLSADATEDGLQRSRVDLRVEVKVSICESLRALAGGGGRGLAAVETGRSSLSLFLKGGWGVGHPLAWET